MSLSRLILSRGLVSMFHLVRDFVLNNHKTRDANHAVRKFNGVPTIK